MKIYIIYSRIFDFEGKELTIGGIQTYLLTLSKLLSKNDYEVFIYQSASSNWKVTYDDIPFIGIDVSGISSVKKQRKKVFDSVLKEYTKNDIVIWGTDSIAIKNDNIKAISIQHGIYFDYLNTKGLKLSILHKLGLDKVNMYLERRRAIKEFLNADIKVCVDYNFLNWIRTIELRSELNNIHIIPNFTHKNNELIEKDTKKIKILFARRFMKERGVFILEKIVNAISEKYDNVEFTIAGSGQLKDYVEKNITNQSNVTLIKYEHTESLRIHAEHDISLVPSYGSEGTSLSLLEAMTSKCIPIASNVGGMTNIILDNYNGYLVNPEADEFIEKIEILIQNTSLREEMAEQAKTSADKAFSYELWSEKWLNIIKCMNHD